MKRKTRQKLVLAALLLVGVLGTFAASNEPILPALENTAVAAVLYRLHWGNSIVFNLSIGILVSLLFWSLLVGLPQANRRRIIKNNLQRQYLAFKRSIIQILIWSAGATASTDECDQLLDHERFKAYFNENQKARWYAAMNGLQNNALRLNELIAEIEVFSQEINHALNNVEIEDDDVYVFFRNISVHLYRLKDDIDPHQHTKSLGGFVWELLARWSFVGGQYQEDVIQKMIDDI